MPGRGQHSTVIANCERQNIDDEGEVSLLVIDFFFSLWNQLHNFLTSLLLTSYLHVVYYWGMIELPVACWEEGDKSRRLLPQLRNSVTDGNGNGESTEHS